MRTYLIVLAIVAVAAISYGFVVPSLVSMRDTFAVVGGFVVALVVAPSAMWSMAKRIVKREESK